MKMEAMADATITHVFFDIGGVLGTNGWDRHERAKAVSRFALDAEAERMPQRLELLGPVDGQRVLHALYI
jgi:hypothetical protein